MSKEKRSAIMSAIRSTKNKSTELKMLQLLRAYKLTGWRRHLKLLGKPDFSWRQQKVALFIDGCFWHGCKKCYKAPQSNPEYWVKKIASNRARDRMVNRALRAAGWKVLRVKECDLKSMQRAKKCLDKIRLLVS